MFFVTLLIFFFFSYAPYLAAGCVYVGAKPVSTETETVGVTPFGCAISGCAISGGDISGRAIDGSAISGRAICGRAMWRRALRDVGLGPAASFSCNTSNQQRVLIV